MDSLKLAKKFTKENVAGGTSKLHPHIDAIKYLMDNNYTLIQIQEYLKQKCNCPIAYSTLHGWVQRHIKNKKIDTLSTNKIEKASTSTQGVSQGNTSSNSKRHVSSPSTRDNRFNFRLDDQKDRDS